MSFPSNLLISESGMRCDAEAVDTEILGDAVNAVFHDTEVVHYSDSFENSDGYDTEVVPDSEDEMMDTNDSKRHSSRGPSLFKRLAADLYEVDFPSHPICTKPDHSHLDTDACGDEGRNALNSGLETDVTVCQGNEASPSIAHTDMQATKLHLQDGNIPTSYNIKLSDDAKEISVKNQVENNDYLSQSKKREVHLVYTRKRNRLLTPKNNEVKDVKRSTDDSNDYTGLSYVDSQEPEDLSTALCFVDQYISVNAMPMLSTPVAAAKTKQNSPPALSSKGAQSLVKTKQNKVGIFEWDDNLDGVGEYFPSEKKDKPQSVFMGKKCSRTYVRRSPSLKSPVLTEQAYKKEASEESTILANTKIHAIPEESECFFDVGIDTQIAAEAIQALSVSISSDCSEIDTDKGPQKLSAKSGEAAQNEKHKGIWSFPRKTRSTYRDISSPNNLFRAQVMESSKQVARRNNGKLAAKSVVGRSSEKSGKVKLTKKAKAYKHKEANMCKENVNGSLSDEDVALCKLKNRRKVKNIHPDSANLKSSSLFNMREGLLSKSTMKRVADRNTIVGLECNLVGYTDWCSRDYPRGKRTCRRLQDCSERHSDLGYSSVRVSKEKQNPYPSRCQSNKESYSGSSVWNSSFKRKLRSTIYISPYLLSSKKCERNSWRQPVCEFKEDDYAKMESTSEQLTESTITLQDSALDVTGFKANENMTSHDATLPSCQTSPSETNLTNLVDGFQEQHDKKKPSTPALTRELQRLGFRESMPEFSPKTSRRRKTMANIRVLLSQNLGESTRKHQMKILMRFGVPVAISPTDATHFVTDRFARTRNMLEFIAQGKPVVTHQWLERCDQAGFYIDDGDCIVRDVKKEHELGFRLSISLDRARRRPLLTGYRVFITPNAKPGKDMLASLVKAAHGEVVEEVMDSKLDNLLILSCDEDQAYCIPFLQQGITVYSSELLLNGIIIQKLEFARHRLFNSPVKGK